MVELYSKGEIKMEYLIVGIASILAGIGTGLVGLSAATAMVPLLIVLCPTFQGEHGAYAATAIALASDILGSAVTTGVYAKNKRIDLKHGWIMLVNIITMCTIGSIAAYFTHQQVLSGFSLFLCVAIGIRFLVKPDSKKKDKLKSEYKLNWKQIIISLFFGITIGFGTGYFGSGGGMMMLIVFTAMLGYDRKTAVGTSTFIMTFTALIASVSHILIEPTILIDAWQYFIIAIVLATISSLISAQFANKVNSKTVGIVTGYILLLIGIIMNVLNYKDKIEIEFIKDVMLGLFTFVMFILPLIVTLLCVRKIRKFGKVYKIPDYIFRKLLHVIAFLCIFPLLYMMKSWKVALAVDLILIVSIIIILKLFENFKFYKQFFVEKGKHEVITSFIILFLMFAIMIGICWGYLGDEYRYIASTAILSWGPGDAMAAIIGKNFGKHKLQGKPIEGIKSVEGTISMFITSLMFTFVSLSFSLNISLVNILVTSIIVALTAAFTELFTKKGLDTITVPIVSMILLLILK